MSEDWQSERSSVIGQGKCAGELAGRAQQRHRQEELTDLSGRNAASELPGRGNVPENWRGRAQGSLKDRGGEEDGTGGYLSGRVGQRHPRKKN